MDVLVNSSSEDSDISPSRIRVRLTMQMGYKGDMTIPSGRVPFTYALDFAIFGTPTRSSDMYPQNMQLPILTGDSKTMCIFNSTHGSDRAVHGVASSRLACDTSLEFGRIPNKYRAVL
jgi:hypothetical protein